MVMETARSCTPIVGTFSSFRKTVGIRARPAGRWWVKERRERRNEGYALLGSEGGVSAHDDDAS